MKLLPLYCQSCLLHLFGLPCAIGGVLSALLEGPWIILLGLDVRTALGPVLLFDVLSAKSG